MVNGKRMTNNMLAVIIALVIGAILIANLLPIAIDQIVSTDTSSWGDTETTLYELLPLFFVLVPLLVVVGWAMKAF